MIMVEILDTQFRRINHLILNFYSSENCVLLFTGRPTQAENIQPAFVLPVM